MEKKNAKIVVVHNEKGRAEKVVKFGPRKEAREKAAEKTAASGTAPKRPERKAPRNVAPKTPPGSRAADRKTPRPVKADKPAAEKPEKKAGSGGSEAEDLTLLINRKEFQEALSVARDFTDRRSSMPVLTHLLIGADTGACTLTATDLEKAWTRRLECFGDDVRRCVPLSVLYSEVKALDADISEVELHFTPGAVRVNRRCEIRTLPAEDFPIQAEFEGEDIEVPGLSGKIARVLPAAGEGDTRYTLNGVYLDFEKGSMVGTDGHRMHIEQIPTAKAGQKIIIPRQTAALMAKHGSADILRVGKNAISSSLAGGLMLSRLIEGTYPAYENVIPKDNRVRLVFRGSELLKILEGAIPLTSANHNAVRMLINGRLEIETRNPDLGHYRWHIPCAIEGKDGGTLTVGFNAGYLIDAIRSYTSKDDDRVEMTLGEALTPCMINAGAVVMPMRV